MFYIRCKDDQTSADASESGKATGAMSYAFTSKFLYTTPVYIFLMLITFFYSIATLRDNPNQSYQALLNSVREILEDKYEQRPQLSASHPIDVNLKFVC